MARSESVVGWAEVTCPGCGQMLNVPVWLEETRMSPTNVWMSFGQVSTQHACKGRHHQEKKR